MNAHREHSSENNLENAWTPSQRFLNSAGGICFYRFSELFLKFALQSEWICSSRESYKAATVTGVSNNKDMHYSRSSNGVEKWICFGRRFASSWFSSHHGNLFVDQFINFKHCYVFKKRADFSPLPPPAVCCLYCFCAFELTCTYFRNEPTKDKEYLHVGDFNLKGTFFLAFPCKLSTHTRCLHD